jgi:hypothetical protein
LYAVEHRDELDWLAYLGAKTPARRPVIPKAFDLDVSKEIPRNMLMVASVG